MRRVSIGKFPRAGPTDSLSIVSRRRFFGTTAAAAGLALGSTLWTPARADDDNDEESIHALSSHQAVGEHCCRRRPS